MSSLPYCIYIGNLQCYGTLVASITQYPRSKQNVFFVRMDSSSYHTDDQSEVNEVTGNVQCLSLIFLNQSMVKKNVSIKKLCDNDFCNFYFCDKSIKIKTFHKQCFKIFAQYQQRDLAKLSENVWILVKSVFFEKLATNSAKFCASKLFSCFIDKVIPCSSKLRIIQEF